RDKRIIAGANANRVGAQFDPEGLVGTVLQNPRSITTFAIVSEAELQVEKPPLPEGFTPQDVLIQYTFTPVRATNSDTVVGVLVSGNIINGEEVIPAAILETLEEGYGAIYQRQSDGSYDLAATTGITAAPTLDAELLSQLQADPAQIFTSRTQANDQSYGLAARTLTNFQQEPVGIIVRGLPESSLNQVLSNKLRLQLLVALLIVVANLGIAYALRNIILNPLKNLQQATWQFGLGERQARADIYSKDEVGQVAYVFNQIADKIVASEDLLYTQQQADRAMARQSQTLVELSSELRQKMDPEHILDTSVDSMRQALEVDRVLIYRFDDDLKSGEITAESVGQGWQRTKGQMVEDPLTPEAIEHFYSGRVNFIEDRDVAGLTHCHCEILKRLEVRANMVAPIIVGDKLVGLLCAHQCSGPRKWTPSELQLMQQLSTQLGYALNQANLMQQQRQTLYWEQQLNEAIARMRETLDEKTIFQIAVNETRQLLESDRSVIYLFDETWKGTFVAESVTDGWSKAINNDLYDPCFADRYVKQYQKGRVQVTPDIYKAGLTDCHINQLETYEVKANLVAPVIVNDELIGLLIVHQCSGPREWDELEVEFIRKISIQLGFAIEQARLLADTRDRQQQLQMQLVELLSDVEGASSGDLTVRANVTAGEIGTVADFFNAIVESLRQIVTKVKESATQVNDSLGENETSIKTLADEALRQADEVTTTLASVQAMTASIQQVADSARQAADVASTASLTAENSGQAMDLTVQNILNLRDIIGETSKKVKRLGESSQQISKVVSLINQIAMQTNLLAINAGIEAARAGEEGQGFAVVAEEVGELAARSADATQEIERIVETIQRETVEVVEAMEQSTTEVVAGTHLVEDAKQSFSRILDVSRQIDQLVQSISSATVSQVEVSETVTKLMQDIAQVSERTSDASLEITSSLRRTVEVAQGLQASVGEFKTGQAQGASSLNAGNPVAQA
ncbi:MAG: GAF domain-containing protein, partial [Cyanobacteria bacterium P01_C01_bin.70]